MKRHKITKVDEGGIAEELGIEEGDFLLAMTKKLKIYLTTTLS